MSPVSVTLLAWALAIADDTATRRGSIVGTFS
jgi:hypothetical protein